MNITAVVIVNYKGTKDTAISLRSLFASDVVPLIVVAVPHPYDPKLSYVIAKYPDAHLISDPRKSWLWWW